MDSPTRVSGVAVSVLVAATGSVLLLLPGHARPRPAPGTGGKTSPCRCCSGPASA